MTRSPFDRIDREELRDALDGEDLRQIYAAVALSKGRPTEPCECRACDCDLHTFPGEVGCLWCSKGQHADGGRDA